MCFLTDVFSIQYCIRTGRKDADALRTDDFLFSYYAQNLVLVNLMLVNSFAFWS